MEQMKLLINAVVKGDGGEDSWSVDAGSQQGELFGRSREILRAAKGSDKTLDHVGVGVV